MRSSIILFTLAIAFAMFAAVLDTDSVEARNNHTAGFIRVDGSTCKFTAHHHWRREKFYAWTSPSPFSNSTGACDRGFVRIGYIDRFGRLRTVTDYGNFQVRHYPYWDSASVTLSARQVFRRDFRHVQWTTHCAKKDWVYDYPAGWRKGRWECRALY